LLIVRFGPGSVSGVEPLSPDPGTGVEDIK